MARLHLVAVGHVGHDGKGLSAGVGDLADDAVGPALVDVDARQVRPAAASVSAVWRP